jgi:UDP-N-acetylmuramoyl-L-alanyl-D-glutamate--2,6-diaminopimelate ligase
MGRAAAGADITIVTTDNPRTEDPVEIARSVQEGALSRATADVRVVLDRAEAIGAAIEVAGDGDVVLILGKGHEQGQDIDGTVHPFDDATVARSFLGTTA